MRCLSCLLLVFLLTGCGDERSYYLLYPIEASKQELLRLKGYRFLSSALDSPSSILVLSNPIENEGFADIALAITNTGKETIHLRAQDLVVKMRGVGELELVSPEAYYEAPAYQRPEGFETLSPKMQAFGCSAANTKDNVKEEGFTASQRWVWDQHLKYPFKDPALYLEALEIPAGETKGAVFRISLPRLQKDFEQSTIMIDVRIKEQDGYRFKFIVQSLQ